MPTDYKKRAPRSRKPQPAPGWVWFVTGFVFGALAVGFAWLELSPPSGDMPRWISGAPEKPAKAVPPRGTAKVRPKASKPREYDFPRELRRMEVDPGVTAPPAVAAQPAPPADIWLQLGSFTKRADAERRKAELALLGVQSKVRSVTTSSGQTYHRVRAGPYRDKRKVERLRRLLRDNRIQSLILPKG